MSPLSMQKCEQIARRVCVLTGVDPDTPVQLPNSSLLDEKGNPSLTDAPYWTLIAHMVPEQVAWFRAITEGLFGTKEKLNG